MDERIIKFINKHHLFTLATVFEGKPWTSSCFYVYERELNLFVFTSDPETNHGKHMLEQRFVAGNIALETRVIGKIKGIQFTGCSRLLKEDELRAGRSAYMKRFPISIIMDTIFWGLEPEMIKMTDNKLGFGRKLYWHKDSKTPSKSG
ncbi:MAG: pyridoxamine 5'-phosphate oxidase family protein [Bacteroidetes bacterium]|nr:pyridoxamine 5'-phosphate oxidase family protein [Bacteroidota bacterium]